MARIKGIETSRVLKFTDAQFAAFESLGHQKFLGRLAAHLADIQRVEISEEHHLIARESMAICQTRNVLLEDDVAALAEVLLHYRTGELVTLLSDWIEAILLDARAYKARRLRQCLSVELGLQRERR